MMEFSSNPFSTIGTSTQISDDGLHIKKFVKHICCPQDVAISLYSSYIESLLGSSLTLPTSVSPYESFICLKQPLYGDKLYSKDDDLDYEYIFHILPQIISLFSFAIDNEVYLDPHLSNFHVSNDIIRLIDFSPPYSLKYNQYVNFKCTTNTERFFLMRNCLYFRWDYLPFHFIADLTELSALSCVYLQEFYRLFKPLIHSHIFFSEFVERCMMIRHHENLRVKLNFNLL